MSDLNFNIIIKTPHKKQKEFIYSDKKRNIICAGRRSGKTTGIAILALIKFLEGNKVLYIAPTGDQTNAFWEEITRTLDPFVGKNVDELKFIKNETLKSIGNYKLFRELKRQHPEKFNGEGKIVAKTAWSADTLRGGSADVLILDEYQMMSEDVWDTVCVPMLLDSGGTSYLIYTPPSIKSVGGSKAKDPRHANKFFKQKQKDPRWNVYNFSSFNNPFLNKEALDEISQDMTQLSYRQEILAENVDEVPGALFTRENLDKYRIRNNEIPEYSTKILALDPSTTEEGDEWGIIICGKAKNIKDEVHYYVDKDFSKNYTPGNAAKYAVELYKHNNLDLIVYEGNQGGDMVKDLILNEDQSIPVKKVTATRGKRTRAEPIAALFEKGFAHIINNKFELEDEMCTTLFDIGNSPNRVDAMVWGISYLYQIENETKNTISSRRLKGFR